tara:strand:+ start:198 stop:725 length:528 start_codon:yes stop_codon:yes gene_type:complete
MPKQKRAKKYKTSDEVTRHSDPLKQKIAAEGRSRRYDRQKKAGKELGITEVDKFTNNQRVNRRAMQQAESQKLQRAARKKQKASDTNKRYAQLVGDTVFPGVSAAIEGAKKDKLIFEMPPDLRADLKKRASKLKKRTSTESTEGWGSRKPNLDARAKAKAVLKRMQTKKKKKDSY